MTVINTNVGALMARTYAATSASRTETSMERLSSGLRINGAADDAAGLAVANKMESQLKGIKMAVRNSQDGISLVQTAESGMGEISNMILRMRELAVQMENGIYTSKDRDNAQLEVNALLQEIDKIASNTRFNDVKLLDGAYDQTVRAGNTNAETIRVAIDALTTASTAKITNFATEKAIVEDDATGPETSGAIADDTASLARALASTNADLNISLDGADGVDADGTDTDITALDGGVVKIDTSVFSTAFKKAFKTDSLGSFEIVAVADSATEATAGTYDATTSGDAAFFTIDSKTGVATSNQAIDYTAPSANTNTAHLAAASANNFSFIVRYTDRDSNVHNERINLTIKKATETNLSQIEVETSAKATRAIETLDKSLEEVSSAQAKLGAIQNRLQHNIDNLSKSAMLTEQSVGRVVDADFATETSNLSKQQILNQAATAMLAQANQSKQSVLSLLQ
jgi:flagellin